MFPLSSLIPFIFHALSRAQKASAGHRNVTIDDTDNTHWTFVGPYHAVTPHSPCLYCEANPDPQRVYNQTWHDGLLRSGSFQFQGSAVYVYGIDIFPVNVTFVLNNPSVTNFHTYSGSDYVYNSLFFAATNLDASAEHTVAWQMEASNKAGFTALFDYAVVTVEDAGASSGASSSSASEPTSSDHVVFSSTSIYPRSSGSASSISSLFFSGPAGTTDVPSSPQKKVNSGAITGAVVGALAVLVILGALLMFRRKRTRGHGLKESLSDHVIEPYRPVDPPPSQIGRPTTSTPARKGRPAPQATASPNSRSDASASQPVVDAMEERVRHLEEVVAVSQPPRYDE